MWSKYTTRRLPSQSVLTTTKKSFLTFIAHHSLLIMSFLRKQESIFCLLLTAYCLFIFAGCASAPEKTSIIKPETTLEIATLTKDVAKMEDDSSPSGEAETFSFNDPQAVMWIKIRNIEGQHNLRWEWYDPNENLYQTTGNYLINKDGQYRRYSTSWHRIAIKDTKASTLSGKWLVKVILDDNPIAIKTFEIKKAVVVEEKLPPLRDDAFAIVIGIDYKERGDIPPLQYSSQDAKKVYEVLTDPRYGGVPKGNAKLLINEQATTNAIISAFNNIKKWDGYVYVYYSGHGAPKIEGEKMVDALLIPHNADIADPQVMEYTSIKVSYLQGLVDSSQAKGVLVALDACFTGSGAKSIMAKGGKPIVGMLATAELIKSTTSNKVVITSSAANQQSWEDDAKIGGGIFSYFLLEGLRGKAGRDIWVKADDIAEYVKVNVPKAVRKAKGEEQTPQVFGKGDFRITRNLGRENFLKSVNEKLGGALARGNITKEQLDKVMNELATREPSPILKQFLEGRLEEKLFGESYGN